MLHELIEDADDPGAVREAWLSALRDVIEAAGRERVASESGLAAERVAAIADGDANLTLSEAAAVLATGDGYPDADAIAAEARDHLLLGMTTAVLDVDTIAANLDADVSATGVQQRIEGRAEMTLAEYAAIYAFIERRKP